MFENLKQLMDTNLDLFEPTEGISVGCGDDDSNAVLLPNRKKTKTKEKSQAKIMERSRLSKSQKMKLQKLEEEKKKEALVSESIKTLEKYKIQEDARSLLLSSGKIGQVETTLEKRRRAVQFSKVGLVSPHIDRPSKKRGREVDCYRSKPDPDESHSRLDHHEVERHSESFDPYQESVSSIQGIDDSSSNALAAEEISNNTDVVNVPKDELCNNEETKSTKSQNKDVNNLKVDCEILADCAAPKPRTVPIVVHVARPNDVEEKRKDLPIVMMEQEIMEAINEHSTVIVCGETGCGKTTQVPQFLYEAGFGSNKNNDKKGIIGVTQPRRVAVLATAKRVAFELGLHLGKEVGFQVRHDRRVGGSCSIKFMTDGILLREVQSDFLLKRYSIILLDEAHERSLNTDILIGMLSRVIQVRQKLYREQQEKILAGVKISPEDMISPLKLVLMSATLRVEDFVSGSKLFREPPPVMEVPTRQFPVTIHFSKRTEIVDYIGQAYKKVMSIHRRLPPGGILVFVTGQGEVEYLCGKLRRASKEMSCNNSEGQTGNEVTAASETNSIEQGIDMKEINEAFENRGHSFDQQTDRFSAYDEDPGYLDKDESYSSDESESELGTDDGDSDFDDYGDSLNQRMSEKGGDLVDLQGEAGSLVSLKATFEASDKLNLPTMKTAEESLNLTSSISGKKYQGPTNRCAGALFVLPLYAMLPAGAQLRVFEEVKEGERLVVVATNVAETSLTIPGIKYVVDTGREKAKKYNSSNGMETYEVQWISKASAAQRAGRAGRTAPGHCYRLYSSAVFSNIFSDFSVAEISKIPVEGVVLLMKSMGIDKVANFPFPTPPEATALVEAERCLKSLEALDHQGRLTPLGKAMAHYPLSPRHSRMLLTVIHIMKNTQNYTRSNLLLGYTVAAAAALSLPNPFIMQFEGGHSNEDGLDQDVKSGNSDSQEILGRKEKLSKKKLKHMAKDARAKFSNPTSDALTTAYALQLFELAKSPVEFCKDNLLHLKTMEEMSKLRKQLLQLVFQQKSFVGDSHPEFAWNHGTVDDVEQGWRVYYDKHPLLLHEEELLGQAICAGWVDRVAKHVRVGSSSSDGDRKVNAAKYQACMVKETVFLHRWSSVARSAPELLVYSELLQTKRPYMHGVTSVKSEWLVKFAGSLCNFSAALTDPKPYYELLNDQVLCWVSPTFGPHLWQLPLHSLPIKDKNFRVSVFAYALLEGHVLPCLRSVQKFLVAPPASILRPEALGQKRIGNLLSKLQGRSKTIESRAMLKQTWNENPQELYSEILDWFQVGFHDQFEELWTQMHLEVLLDPKELFPKRRKKEKRLIKKTNS